MLIQVDYAVLAEYWQQLLDTIDAFDEHLDEIRATVAAVRAVWEGEAADSFDAAYRDWESAYTATREDLSWIHGALGTAQSNYSGAEDAAVATWRVD